MAVKKITYKEPSSYFSSGMKKAADDYEKKQAAENNKQTKSDSGKGSKKK